MRRRRKWSADPILQAARALVEAETNRRRALMYFNREEISGGDLKHRTWFFGRLEHAIAVVEKKRDELIRLAREWSVSHGHERSPR
jgi:hypothetical protein